MQSRNERSTMQNKIKGYLTHPLKLFVFVQNRCNYKILPDSWYLKILYKVRTGKKLNLNNPQSFNEKLQWLKLNCREPQLGLLVDKYNVKKYVASIIGETYIIPTLGVWDKFDDIDFARMPERFVLKCTHDSGGISICKDIDSFDKRVAKEKLEKAMHTNYYVKNREWPYSCVERKIIAEKYVEDENSGNLLDYKIMCFNGKAKCSFVCTRRFSDEQMRVTFFDRDWKKMPFERYYHAEDKEIKKPESYELMLDLAEKIASAIKLPFARIDFYEVNKKPLFGEITLFPGSGMEPFMPDEWDYILGEWIDLQNK